MYVSKNFDTILKKFEKDLNAYENLENLTFIPSLPYATDRSSRSQFNLIQNWSILCDTELTNEMKRILFKTYEDYYESNNNIIKEFKEKLEPSTSISWYIKQPKISRLFNNACRKAYWNSIWKFQYFIRCLDIQLREEHSLFIRNFNKKSFYVYRAQLMTTIQFKQFKMQIGKTISITSFILANFDKDKVIYYINQCQPSENEIIFIFKILINIHLKNTQSYAPIYSDNEQQLLIMLGAQFYLIDLILNPHGDIPIVLLQLCNNKS
jgi:hypothetical protein